MLAASGELRAAPDPLLGEPRKGRVGRDIEVEKKRKG
jgi:hypothetical protein